MIIEFKNQKGQFASFDDSYELIDIHIYTFCQLTWVASLDLTIPPIFEKCFNINFVKRFIEERLK